MKLMLAFFKMHPLRASLLILAMLLAGVAEGIGLSALLPLLSIAVNDESVTAITGTVGIQRSEFEQQVIALLNKMGLSPTLGTLLLIVLLGVTLRNILLLLAKRQVGYTGAQVITELRLDLLRALLYCRWPYFLHQPIGRLTNALAMEASRTSKAFIAGAEAMTFGIQGIVYGGIALAVDWRATMVALLAGAIIMAVLHTLVRATKMAGRKQTRLLKALMAQLTDTLQSVKPLKSMAKEQRVNDVLAVKTRRINQALRRQASSGAILNAVQDEMFTLLVGAGIFIMLVYFNMAFSTVALLAVGIGRMLSFFGKMQKQHQQMAMGENAYWSLRQTIDDAWKAEEHLGDGKMPTLRQGIHCQNITFSYDEHPVLKDLTMVFPVGQLTTLIGPSGGGKTTVIDLVLGLIRPQQGVVLIDGKAIDTLDIKAWRTMIGYVPQENLLLHDTIAYNITLGDEAFDDQEVQRALKEAGAWSFVQAMSDGIHTVVGERGGKLSGGQRQRIMIARALVHRPSLLILDEATSALDPTSAAAIQKTLERLRGRYTILAISHQSALMEAADRVYRLEHGRAILVN